MLRAGVLRCRDGGPRGAVELAQQVLIGFVNVAPLGVTDFRLLVATRKLNTTIKPSTAIKYTSRNVHVTTHNHQAISNTSRKLHLETRRCTHRHGQQGVQIHVGCRARGAGRGCTARRRCSGGGSSSGWSRGGDLHSCGSGRGGWRRSMRRGLRLSVVRRCRASMQAVQLSQQVLIGIVHIAALGVADFRLLVAARELPTSINARPRRLV